MARVDGAWECLLSLEEVGERARLPPPGCMGLTPFPPSLPPPPPDPCSRPDSGVGPSRRAPAGVGKAGGRQGCAGGGGGAASRAGNCAHAAVERHVHEEPGPTHGALGQGWAVGWADGLPHNWWRGRRHEVSPPVAAGNAHPSLPLSPLPLPLPHPAPHRCMAPRKVIASWLCCLWAGAFEGSGRAPAARAPMGCERWRRCTAAAAAAVECPVVAHISVTSCQPAWQRAGARTGGEHARKGQSRLLLNLCPASSRTRKGMV